MVLLSHFMRRVGCMRISSVEFQELLKVRNYFTYRVTIAQPVLNV